MKIQNDQVVLVDEHDQVIGVMDKVEAHRGQAQLHRAISVYLINNQGELLVQQRSQQKIVGAGQWANTCCGNVWPGESYEACAHRRLQHELGITEVTLQPIYKFIYQVQCNQEFSEHEMDQVFVGKYDGTVEPNPHEVSAVRWVKLTEVMGQELSEEYAPWFRLMMKDEKLLTLLQEEIWEKS